MKEGQSIAASVVAQARARRRSPIHGISSEEPVGLRDVKTLHSYLDRTPDPISDAPRLRVIIPGQGTPEIHDFSPLLVQEELALILAEGFRCWAAGVGIPARRVQKSKLNQFAGLFASWPKVVPWEIDEAFWAAILRWLNAPRDNGQPLSPTSRAKLLQSIGSSIKALLDHPNYHALAKFLYFQSGFPVNPWPGRSKKVVPTAVLSPLERDNLVVACLREIREIKSRLDKNDIILSQGRSKLESAIIEQTKPDFIGEVGICAAYIEKHFPNRLALLSDLKKIDNDLYAAVRKHSLFSTRQILYTNFRDLVPFVLLIGIKTAFNAETLLTLNWSNIRYSFDGHLITLVGEKNRQAKSQNSTIEKNAEIMDSASLNYQTEIGIPFGLGDILDTLRRLTAGTRPILDDATHSDRLFIGVPIGGGSVAKAFSGNKLLAVHDPTWKWAIKKFIADNKLNPFTLKTLRATEGDLEYRRTGGDLKAVQSRLGHKTTQTTRTYYTSDWMRRSGQDRIAETQALYIRWASSEGVIDPRGKEPYMRGATTPGFMCLDPYDSPRSGQQKGKLCAAYGECPSCPFAAAKPNDPQAVALYQALYAAIFKGQQGRVTGQGWTVKWSPIIHDLNRLLALVPDYVKAEAIQFRINLKAVG